MNDKRQGLAMEGTTILCLRRGKQVVMVGDGQITLGNTVMKSSANKLRSLGEKKIVTGFAGSTADAFALFGLLEEKLEKYAYNLKRACVEMAKDWRTDRRLRRLESMLIAANKEETFLVSGAGDVIDPEDGVIAIGSGGSYALAAARALLRHSRLSLREIAQEAMEIAAAICIYTNDHLSYEVIDEEDKNGTKSKRDS